MRSKQVFLVAGVALAVAGFIVMDYSHVPLERTETRTLSSTPDVIDSTATTPVGFWVVSKFSLWIEGQLWGSWSADIPAGIDEFDILWLIIDQSTYDNYWLPGYSEGVLMIHHGFNDSVSEIGSVHLPTSGNYYLIIESLVPIPEQFDVTIDCGVDGLNLRLLLPGVITILVAAALFMTGSVTSGSLPRKKP